MDELNIDSDPPKLDELPEFIFPELPREGTAVAGDGIAVTEDGEGSIIVSARGRRGTSFFADAEGTSAGASSALLESLMFWTTKISTGYRVAAGKVHYIRYIDAVWRRVTADLPNTTLTTTAVSGFVYVKIPFETLNGSVSSATGSWDIEGSSYAYEIDYAVQYHAVKQDPGISIEFSGSLKTHGDASSDWYLIAEIYGGVVAQKHVGNLLMLQSAIPLLQEISVT